MCGIIILPIAFGKGPFHTLYFQTKVSCRKQKTFILLYLVWAAKVKLFLKSMDCSQAVTEACQLAWGLLGHLEHWLGRRQTSHPDLPAWFSPSTQQCDQIHQWAFSQPPLSSTQLDSTRLDSTQLNSTQLNSPSFHGGSSLLHNNFSTGSWFEMIPHLEELILLHLLQGKSTGVVQTRCPHFTCWVRWEPIPGIVVMCLA